MMKRRISALGRLGSAALAGCVAAVLPQPVGAQEAQSDAIALDEITVTARKREEDIRNVPMSIHVETAETLEQKRALDTPAMLRDVAGASMGVFGDRSNAFVVMRGVAPILSPLSPDDSSVLTFVDGAPLPISASYSSSYLDLARVEVLKGPQNTLFGRNTSGGAINLIPAEPTHVFGGHVRAEIGTDGIYRTEGMLNGSVVPDVLAARVALRRSRASGYIPNMAGEDLGKEESWVGRASLLFTPTQQTRWLLSVQGEDTKTSPTVYIANRPGQPKLAAQTRTNDDINLFALNSRFEHDFGTLTFTSQTSYARLNARNAYNYPDANIASDFSGLPASAFLDPLTNYIDWHKRDTRLSQEFRLNSAPGAAIGWLAGISLYQDKAKRDRSSAMWYFGPSAAGAMTYDATTTGQAVFGEISYPLAERLKLSVGGRGTREAKRFSARYSSDGQAGTVPFFAERDSRNYAYLTGRAALSYEWSDTLTSYASIARGYKSGGFSLGNSLMWSGVARTPYDSSTVLTYEAGLRSSWLDNRLQVNGATFFNDMKKEQMQTWDYTNFVGNNLNLDAQSAGFEVDLTYRMTTNWTFAAGLAYTYSALRNVSAEASAAQEGLRNGNRLPTVPEWTGRAAIEYRAKGGELGLAGALADKTFSARLAYNYIGTRFTDASNFGKLPVAHILSARAGIDWGGGEAYVFGDNLLDKEYMTIKDRFGTDPAGNPVFGVSYARGATVGAGTSIRF